MTTGGADWDGFRDLEVVVIVEAGRTQVRLADAVDLLREGSIIELDHPAGAPLDILVGGRRVARGECFLDGDRVSVRVAQLETASSDPGSADR